MPTTSNKHDQTSTLAMTSPTVNLPPVSFYVSGSGGPVMTDRHGFIIALGDTVVKIQDDSRFVVTRVEEVGTSPVVFLLDDDRGGVVDASCVMMDDAQRNSRATFCEVCFNHFEGGVTWFEKPFVYPQQRHHVYSACDTCLENIE